MEEGSFLAVGFMDLLEEIRFPLKGSRAPFLMEIPVSPESAPYLVTGTRSLLWIEAPRNGVIRSGIRSGSPDPAFYRALVGEISSQGGKRGWGNSFPSTTAGMGKAVEYLRGYGFEESVLLVSPGSKIKPPSGVEKVPVSWISSGSVLVPKDRSYLGVLGFLGDKNWTAVVHNPSRGMAVLGRW